MRYRVGFVGFRWFLGYFWRFWVILGGFGLILDDFGGFGVISLGSWSRIADEV